MDGDEYAVYWDLDLMFDKNEEAMHFPKEKPDPIPGGVKVSFLFFFGNFEILKKFLFKFSLLFCERIKI